MHQNSGAMELERAPTPPVERGCLQERDQNHQCTRFCTFRPVFGNLYFCETGGKLHVCDSNCTQRVYYDCSSTICRLSRKVFPMSNAAAPAPFRKRRSFGEDAPEFVPEKKWCH